MKKLLIFNLLIIMALIVRAQHIGSYLERKINGAEGKNIPIIIVLNQQWDSDSALYAMRNQKMKASDRIRTTVLSVKAFTQKNQKNVLQTLNHMKGIHVLKNIRPFWAANIIALEASADVIYQLAMHPDVYEVFYDEPAYAIYPSEVATEIEDGRRSGTALRGIKAINAPALWNLGYTGKGRIAFGVDTGVFPDNPAFENRFLGNYLPLSQCWFGYNNNWPFDITDHGTHTMGTTLGFLSAYNDTIGVAFNARFIASDPIVGDLSELRTRSELMESFQWALDPDGNSYTVTDVPDVINNSWGLSNTDNPENCDLSSTLILNTVNAAGIAVVFSAGNDGPGVSTIGEPAHISRSTTNVFSVGAVNSTSLNIADFSSRGPTNCYLGNDTSLVIKPEVSAPGVNVLSCTGTSTFGYMSGTSMAGPHVTGAVLLLKEAFPEVPGDEILLALYNTATDLGEIGEDNVYGNGLINCEAAFQNLSENYMVVSPVNEQSNPYVSFSNRTLLGPLDIYEISFDVRNETDDAFLITGFQLFENEMAIEHTFEVADSGSFYRVILQIDASALAAELSEKHLLQGSMSTDVSDDDLIDNQFWFNIFHPEIHDVPFLETFETSGFDFINSSIMPQNPDRFIGWRVDTVGGFVNNRYAARMNFVKYERMEGERDYMCLPPVNISGVEQSNISFRYAHAKRLYTFYKDTLLVLAHYGASYENTDTLFSKYGENLATVEGNYGSQQFVPSAFQQWKDTTISLAHLSSHGLIRVEFIAINDNGNNLYIDDIAIYGGENPLVGEENPVFGQGVVIYPNPAGESITITSIEKYQRLVVVDLSGRVLKERVVTNFLPNGILPISELKPGVYLLQIISDKGVVSKKFMKY